MLPGLGAHAGRGQSRKAVASGRRACTRTRPLRSIGRAIAAAAVAATAAIEVVAPFPAVGVAAAAAAPAVVAALRVRVFAGTRSGVRFSAASTAASGSG